MQRRKFSRGFKLDAVELVPERRVSAAQVARDLDVPENVPRLWVRDFSSDPGQAIPGHRQIKPLIAVGLQLIPILGEHRDDSSPSFASLSRAPGPLQGSQSTQASI